MPVSRTRYRLAFAVVKYFPFGGMQRNLLRIARACAERGHDVHVYASEWDGPQPDDLTVHVLAVKAKTNHGRNERFGRALRAAVRGRGFDCIVGSNRLPDLHVYYAGDPCYAAWFRRHRPALFSLLPRYRGFLRQEGQVFGRHLDTDILLAAHGEREKFIAHYGTDPGRFVMLPPGIDRRRLGPAPDPADRHALRVELGAGGEDDALILCVGSSFRTKGLDRSIKALASLPPEFRSRAWLVVVGRGNARPFETAARRLGVADRVRFAGPREDLAAFYHAADMLMHPALLENTGNALIEAMVCGLPVLATETCGYAFHVQRAGAGLICPSPFAQDVLDELLLRMITSPQRAEWSANALAYCAREDLYTMIDRAADAIEQRAARNTGNTGVTPARCAGVVQAPARG